MFSGHYETPTPDMYKAATPLRLRLRRPDGGFEVQVMDAKSVEKRLLASAHITAAMNGIAVESVEEYDMAHVVHTLRAELTEAKKPDCNRCRRYHRHGFGEGVCANTLIGEPACINGDGFREADPVRLYEINTTMTERT